jgi:hypothetical protein
MSEREVIGKVQMQPRNVAAEPTLEMRGPAVVWSHTGQRDIQSPLDFGVFDGNKGIIERRAATIPARMELFRRSQR